MKKLIIILSALSFAHTAIAADIEDTLNVKKRVIHDQNNLMTVAAVSSTAGASLQNSAVPVEEEQLTSDGDVFGSKYGRFHGSLSVNGEWTDNLYNVDYDKQDNYLTTVSGDVWYTYPERSMTAVHISNHNTSPGGLQFSPAENKYYNKYQINIGGNLYYDNYSQNSDLDMLGGGANGMFQYNPSTKLTLQLADNYMYGQDQFDLSNATEDNQRIYGSNVFMASADWQITTKFSAKIDYRNFGLAYEDTFNDFLDRNDQGIGIAGYFDYSPKTNFFLQYETLFAAYDNEYDEINRDNTNGYWYAGVNWQSTVKTALMAKAGYQDIDYDSAEYEDTDTFTGELQWNWKATLKSSVLLDGTYSVEQSDSEVALNKTVLAARLGLMHRFTDRLKGNVDFIYENSDYEQLIDIPRTDDRYYVKPALQLALWKWLWVEAYYMYDNKDSSNDLLDYDTNTFGLGLHGSL